MVYTIPTFDLGAAFGGGLGQGIASSLGQLGQRQMQSQEADRLRQALSGLSPEQMQDPQQLFSALSQYPDIAKELSRQQLERQELESKRSLEKETLGLKERQVKLLEEKEKRKREILSQFLGQSESPSQFLEDQKMTPKQQRKTAEDLTDQEIIAVAQDDPTLARILQDQRDTLVKNKLNIHKDSAQYDEKIRENAERSTKQLEAIKDIRDSVSSGKVTPFKFANIFKPISSTLSNAFLNAEQGKVEASIPLLLEGWREVFGTRISDADLRVLLGKLPSIGKTQEANEAILSLLEKYAKPTLVKRQVAKEIKSQFQGFRPINFEDLVEEETMNRLKTEGNNQRQKVNPGTPITNEIADYYLDISGNDPTKAAEMAKEDGYEF